MAPGAFVWADNEKEARELLDKQLVSSGLEPFAKVPFTLQPVDQFNTHKTHQAQLFMKLGVGSF